MDFKYSDTVLKQAGYIEHETFYKGQWKKGYIKEGYKEKRFHAFILDDEIELHVDKTINNRHVVMNKEYITWINKEHANLRKIYRRLKPSVRIIGKRQRKIQERRLKNEYAPNLLELQRNSNKKVPEIGFLNKVKDFLFK